LREQVVKLERHDDHQSARDKMGQARVDRILLVWPKHVRRKPQPLSRKLDLVLMHRHASRLGAHLGIVTADDLIVDNAGELGLPVFDSVRDAHLFIWRSRHSLRPNFTPPPNNPPAIEVAREQLVSRSHSYVNQGWHLARGGFFTALGLLAVAILLLLTFPSAEVRLTPTNQLMTIELTVTGDPTLTEPDYANARIPALTETKVISAAIEMPTTGNSDLSTKAAHGTVIFTNLTEQRITIPAGTAVRTTGGVPVRFVTQQDATLEAKRGMITTALVQASDPGPQANVKAALINRIEGPLQQRVAVTNRQPTTGGETITVPSVTSSDRSRAYQALLTQLRHNGYATIVANLPPYQFSAFDTAKIQKVTERNYSHFVGEHADTFTLEVRATVTSSVVNNHDVLQASLHALQNSIGSDMTIQEDTINYSRSNSISGDEAGAITFDVTAMATALPRIDPAAVKHTVRWKPVNEAREHLYANFPLSHPPTITMSPSWLPRTPWLEWRTTVMFSAGETLFQNENIGS